MLGKVFVAAAAGTWLGAVLEPKITPKLPPQLTQGNTAKIAIHVSIAGGSAVVIFWGLTRVVKA